MRLPGPAARVGNCAPEAGFSQDAWHPYPLCIKLDVPATNTEIKCVIERALPCCYAQNGGVTSCSLQNGKLDENGFLRFVFGAVGNESLGWNH